MDWSIETSTLVKSSLYLSLVRPILSPILEYASTIWSPHHKNHIQLIEAVQRKAARLAVNRYSRYQSVTDTLKQLDWPTFNKGKTK